MKKTDWEYKFDKTFRFEEVSWSWDEDEEIRAFIRNLLTEQKATIIKEIEKMDYMKLIQGKNEMWVDVGVAKLVRIPDVINIIKKI